MANDFDLSLLPSGAFIQFYRIFLSFALTLSFISIGIQTTVILRASPKQMGNYKWLLLNEAIWNFAFDCFLSSYQAIPTFPMPCLYSVSVLFGKHGSQSTTRAVTILAGLCGIGKIHAMSIAFAHRLIHAISNQFELMGFYGWVTPWSQILLFFGPTIIVFSIFWFDDNYLIESRQMVIGQGAVIGDLYAREPTLMCLKPSELGTKVLFGTVAVFCVIFCWIVLLSFSIRILRTSERLLTPATFKLQWMLLKSCAIQNVIGDIWLVIPFFFVVFYCAVYQFPFSNTIACLCNCFVSTHSAIDCFTVLWFIRPYRDYLLKSITRNLKPKDTRSSVVVRPIEIRELSHPLP